MHASKLDYLFDGTDICNALFEFELSLYVLVLWCWCYFNAVVAAFKVNIVCLQHEMFTCISKFYTVSEWTKFAQEHADALEVRHLSLALCSGSYNSL